MSSKPATGSPRRRRIALLGATGSIGTTTLKVISQHPDQLELAGIAARRFSDRLREIVEAHAPPTVALTDDIWRAEQPDFPGSARPQFFGGSDALTELVEATRPDVLVVAVVGTAALRPTLRALELGIDVALASKEILVLAGEFVLATAARSGARLLPMDSEHNAVFQCLQASPRDQLDKIILTASGGPFRDSSLAEMSKVTPREALRHPNWSMGPKITIDSATMANKGLEVIEARWLFDLTPEQIEVTVHPESIIHSLVQWRDGSILAQLSPPDMAFAIQHCLFFPERATAPAPTLDFKTAMSLRLGPPDLERFPCLRLAYEALRQGGVSPGVFNAANEEAVAAFLAGKIPFLRIPSLIEGTLAACQGPTPATLEELLAGEAGSRTVARGLIG
jgi:1-deoxy-D-xylulose-5-phosphate reductoisomerase